MNFKTAFISSLVILALLSVSYATMDSSGEFAADEPSDETFDYRIVEGNTVSIIGFHNKSKYDDKTEVAIPDTTTISTVEYTIVGVDNMAFNHAKCESIKIGKNVEFIKSHDAENVKKFSVNKDNEYFAVYKGTLVGDFNEGKILMTYDEKTVVAAAVDAPKELGGDCFPESMTSFGIGSYNYVDFSEAFNGKALVIPNVSNIPDYAFFNARFQNKADDDTVQSIVKLVIPNTVNYIGKQAFDGNALSETSRKVELTLGNDMYSIGENAFRGRDLFKGTLEINAIMILDGAFRSCDGFTSVVFGENVAYIGQDAFYDSDTLAGTLIIPSTVLFVGPGAFAGCDALKGLEVDAKIISGIPSNGAFQDCDNIQYFKLGSNVSYIGDYAFYKCSSIKCDHIVFSDSLSYIGDYAFGKCLMLNGTTFTFNCQPRSIGFHAFDLGKNTSITIESSGWAKSVFKNGDYSRLGETIVSNYITTNNSNGDDGSVSLIVAVLIAAVCLFGGVGGTYYYLTRYKK